MAMKERYYTVDGQMIGYKDAAGRKDFLTDALGSVTAEVDQTGATKTFDGRYKPYGGDLSSTGSRGSYGWVGTRGYRGNVLSASSHYVRARHYSKTSGVWTSVDPLWPNESTYSYVNGSPTYYIDPGGLQLQGAPAPVVHPVFRSPFRPPIQYPTQGIIAPGTGVPGGGYMDMIPGNNPGFPKPNPLAPPIFYAPPPVHVPWDAQPCMVSGNQIVIKDRPSETLPPWLNPPWMPEPISMGKRKPKRDPIDETHPNYPKLPLPENPFEPRPGCKGQPPCPPRITFDKDQKMGDYGLWLLPPPPHWGTCYGDHTHIIFSIRIPPSCNCQDVSRQPLQCFGTFIGS